MSIISFSVLGLISKHVWNAQDDSHPNPDNFQNLTFSKGTLIIAPGSIISQWTSEAKRHAPALRVYEYNGAAKDSITAEQLAKYDLVLVYYEVSHKSYSSLNETILILTALCNRHSNLNFHTQHHLQIDLVEKVNNKKSGNLGIDLLNYFDSRQVWVQNESFGSNFVVPLYPRRGTNGRNYNYKSR